MFDKVEFVEIVTSDQWLVTSCWAGHPHPIIIGAKRPITDH